MPDRQQKYEAVPLEGRLFQGEIVSGLIQAYQRLDTVGANEPPVLEERVHPFAIVITQDCDLESDFRNRNREETERKPVSLINVLFCEAIETAQLKGAMPPGKDIWKRVIQNKDERYECLEEVPKARDTQTTGIAPVGIDFKRYFTISTDEVYARIRLGQVRRRCRLITPYAEHLVSRFCYFQSRLALPQDHDVPM